MSKKNSVKVIGFGTFDGLHPGHLSYLQQLRELGDEVCVVVARDNNVCKFKFRPPKNNENIRLKDVKDSALVEHVVLGDKEDCYKCISDYNPDVIGLGYDQRANEDEIMSRFPNIEIIRLEAFEPEKHKSSLRR